MSLPLIKSQSEPQPRPVPAAAVSLHRLDWRAGGDRQRFLRVAERIHRQDPHWVAPLDSEMHAVLGLANPFHAHAEVQLWVAMRDGRETGRIAAVEDRSHNALHGERTAFFGFFDCMDDPAVSAALFEAVSAWAAERGLDRLLGPMNPSINDECGLLVEGFDRPPTLMTTYNPPYYARLLAQGGFVKAKDLYGFQIRVADAPAERLQRFLDRFARRHPDIQLRAVSHRSLAADVPRIKQVYNLAWERNWAAVPLTDAEIDFLVARLKPLLIPGMAWLAESRGEPAGFLLALPAFNQVLKPLRGRLLSPGLLRAIPYLAGWKRPPGFRLVALGVRREFHGRGIESAMLAQTLAACRREGFQECEASWTLEDNVPVHRLAELFGGRRHKIWRLYQRPVPPK
ncbi:MAG: GNAT family N-acetyltransferase, partial [Verrucomicrobiae bacterium]|nr:GNAT family N-acetyltransferase [Verrucomicrobiae bacterium]